MHGISTGAGFGSFGSIRNTLMPSQNNLNTWLKSATTDGETLTNVEGTNATLTGINVLDFDGSNDTATTPTISDTIHEYSITFKSDVSFSGNNQMISEATGSVTNLGQNLFYLRDATNGLRVGFTDDSLVIPFSEFTESQYNTVTYKFNSSSNQHEAYLNGVLKDTSTSTTSAPVFSSTVRVGSTSFNGQITKAHMINSAGDKVYDYTFAEGSGTKVFDISGQGNHATISGATYTTANSIASHNNLNGFDKDIFRGYTGYWDDLSGGAGTWVANANNLTLTGNTGVSDKLRQSVFGLVSGDTLVVSGTVVQTGATGGSNQDLAISSASAGWTQGSVFLGGEIGTYTFSTTLNANSSTCDIQFVVLNAAQVVISDLKFVVVKKIPALINKTKQGYTGDGVLDKIHFAHSLNASSDFEAESEFIVNDPTVSLQAVFSATGNTGNDYGFFLRYEASSTRWLLKIGNGTHTITSHTIARGDVYKFNLKYHSSTQKCTLTMTKNGTTTTPIDNASVSNVPDFNGQAALGALRWSTSYAGFTFKTCKFTQGTTTNVELDIANSAGLSTVADLSGNGNNGTLQSATLSLNWGKRYVDSDGSIVGADYAVGNTSVSNPSGYVHNGSECGLDLITTDVSASDIASINNASATQTFAKRDATNSELVTQLLQYSSTISGGDLVRTRRYVS